ncbi:MAG: sensor histidine kinase [Acidimicrobiales bacterium]
MYRRPLAQPLDLIRICLHLLVAVLLALAAGRAVVGRGADVPAVLAASVAMAAVYVLGPVVVGVRRSRPVAVVWLGALAAAWLVLLGFSPDGVWLAFPLCLIQMHLLPRRVGLGAVAATTILAVASFSWHHHVVTTAGVIGPVIGAGVAVATVLGYQALYRESEQRRRLIEELSAARKELAAADHAAGVMAERERLSREIHDTLAQGLASIQLLLRAAERALPARPDAAAVHVHQARQAAQANLAEARRFVHALSPPDLEDASLPAALEQLCATTALRSGLEVNFHLSGTPTSVPAPYEVALLRIAQSALANTVRHARATRAEVTLSYMDDTVALDAFDDGVGFDIDAVPTSGSLDGGFGLAAMRARAQALGGTLSVESAPGQGTALAVSFVPRDDVGATPNP